MEKYIDMDDMNPHLVRISRFDRSDYKTNLLTSCHHCEYYEIEYHLTDGNGTYVDDVFYQTPMHTLHFRKPGQKLQAMLPNNCILLVFSLEKTIQEEIYLFDKPNEIKPIATPLCHELEQIPNVFIPQNHQWYFDTFYEMLKEEITKTPISKMKLQGLLRLIIYQMQADLLQKPLPSDIPLSSYTSIMHAKEFIQSRYMEDISVSDISRHANMSSSHFHALFAKIFGITPNAYLQDFRLQKAQKLLVMTHLPIYKVAEKVGFKSSAYFNSVFKKELGISPLHYRKREITN